MSMHELELLCDEDINYQELQAICTRYKGIPFYKPTAGGSYKCSFTFTSSADMRSAQLSVSRRYGVRVYCRLTTHLGKKRGD